MVPPLHQRRMQHRAGVWGGAQCWGLLVSRLQVTLFSPGAPRGWLRDSSTPATVGPCSHLVYPAEESLEEVGNPPGEKYQDSAHSPPDTHT